ncbi:ester cyclase (plasmid) [Rhizobium johnstonii]|nr:ester cyclase [Rhizobium johnstonii]
MSSTASIDIVHNFWSEVWQSPQNPDAIDHLVAEDFMIVSGGVAIQSRDQFKQWVKDFQSKIIDLEFEIIETFQNHDGTRVASRWRVTGKNNGIMGTEANQVPIEMLGTAIWSVLEDGRLHRNWVERNAWEVHRELTKVSA